MAKHPAWMIIPVFYPAVGGAERQAQRVSQVLMADHNLAVTVLTRRHSPLLPSNLLASDCLNGLPIWRLSVRSPILRRKAVRLRFFLNGLWYLLRHGRGGGNFHAHDDRESAWLAVVARRLLGGRAIIKLRSGRYRYAQLTGWRAWLFYWRLNLADHVIAVNQEVVDLLREHGVGPPRVVWIPNGVDVEDFYPNPELDRSALRARLNLPGDKTLALFVGRLHSHKGSDVLLDAWARLGEAVRAETVLVLVGDGRQSAALRAMIDRAALGDSVKMVGMQTQVRDYYWAADFLVLPSRTEGLSNSLIEAFACGLPAVASNVGGALDIVEEGKNGLLFETENPDSLAQAVGEMLEMRSQWRAMGECARQTVMAKNDLHRVADAIWQLYR